MLQRIQTVYLVFGSIISFVAAYELLSFDVSLFFNSINFFNAMLGTFILTAFLSLYAIFMFKNRALQLKLCTFSISINLLLLGLFVYLFLMLPGEINISEKGIWVTLSLVISLLFLFLAVRGIKKDDDLVKSVDRLR